MGVKRFLKVSVFLLALALLAFVSALLTMKLATWSRTVVVPDVSGRDLATAITTLKESGLDIKVERQEHHPSVPEGSVIQQNPLPGTTVKKGRNVSVVVSQGSEEVNVPALTGDVIRRVQVALKQAGLTLGDVARAYSESPAEVVLAQDPPAQAAAQKGGKVDLLVSSGPEKAGFITPDLAGKSVTEAEAAVKPMNVGIAATGSGRAVMAQNPKCGFPVHAGEVIKLTMGTPTVPAGGQAPGAKPPAQPQPRAGGNAPPLVKAPAPVQPAPVKPQAPLSEGTR